MLESITVKNLALVKESEVELGEGLNILTGETGAGKSIILGSVKMALGGRGSRDIIGRAGDYCLVELTFKTGSKDVRTKCEELDIPLWDDRIVITRRISESRSVLKVNGETVSAKARYIAVVHKVIPPFRRLLRDNHIVLQGQRIHLVLSALAETDV